jgi:hypothetical protein
MFQDVGTEKKVDIVFWLLLGVIAQILLAILNKYIHWCVYWGTEDAKFKKSRCYKIAEKVSSWIWIDLTADGLASVMYAVAACKMFRC